MPLPARTIRRLLLARVLVTSLAAVSIPLSATNQSSLAHRPADIDVALQRTRQYVTRFAREMPFVLAREHYEQIVRSPMGSFGKTAGVVSARRLTESEVRMAHLARGVWFMSREVLSVDGVRLAPSASQTAAGDDLTSENTIALMKRVIAENARWNLGGIHRNINSPTLVLWFLTDEMYDHFRFRVAGEERLASGERCDVYSLQEVGAPLMQVDGAATAAAGQVWVLRDTGEVVKTTLTLERGRSAEVQARARVDVTYMRDSRLNFWVPATMVERYEYPRDREADTLTAKAEYSGYQRFEVGVRIK